MDTVIKPRSLSIKQKKPRPKSIHRDHIESPKTPIKGPPGNRCSCGKKSLFMLKTPACFLVLTAH